MITARLAAEVLAELATVSAIAGIICSPRTRRTVLRATATLVAVSVLFTPAVSAAAVAIELGQPQVDQTQEIIQQMVARLETDLEAPSPTSPTFLPPGG